MTVTPLGSRSDLAAMRGRPQRGRARSAIASSGTSNSSATAVAASTFGEVAAPDERRRRARTRPRGVVTRARVPSMPRSTTSVARTSAPRSIAERHRRARQTRRAAPRCGRRRRWRPAASTGVAPSRISALASAIASTDAKKPRCASPTLVHTRTSGSATRDQRADLAGVIHAQFDDGDLRPLPQLDERQRQPDVVVEVPAVAHHAIPRRQKLRRHFLRRGLAGAAGDRHDLACPTRAAPRAPAPAAPRVVSSTSIDDRRRRSGTAERAPRPRGTTTPAGARVDRRRRELVRRRTARRECATNSSPGASVRVSIDTPSNSRVADRRDDHRAAHGRGDPVRASAELATVAASSHDARVRPPARQRLARHRHVVERQHAIADHLVLLVPLAGDRARGRRARASSIALRDRRRARSTIVSSRCALSRRVSGGDAALDLLDDPRPDPRCAGCRT